MKNFHFHILIFCLAIIAAAPAIAADNNDDPYSRGDYEAAVTAYQKKIKTTGPNADLLYNLGNAHYRLKQYGPAILAYEKALALDPRSSDIRTNLKTARAAALAFSETGPSRWLKPFYWLSLNQWMSIALAALFILAGISLLRAWKNSKKLPGWQTYTAIAAVALLILSALAVTLRYGESTRLIVIKPEAKIRISPFEKADPVATIKAGKSLKAGKEHKGFYHVESGWISKNEVAPVYETKHREL